jgi:hypothetical protein
MGFLAASHLIEVVLYRGHRLLMPSNSFVMHYLATFQTLVGNVEEASVADLTTQV